MILRDDKTQTFEVTLKNRQGTTDVVSNVLDISELGAEFVSVPDKVKKSLGLSYGLQIKSLKKGKLQEAGILSSFVILKINNQPIRSKDELENIYNTAKNSGERGEKVLFIAGVYPNGKVAYYAIDLTE